MTLFIANAFGVPDRRSQLAEGKNVVPLLALRAHNKQCRHLLCWVIAQACRVGEADRGRQQIHRPQQFERSLAAVAAHV